MTMLYVWLGVVALSIIIEFITFELVSIWFIAGGLVAMLLAGLKVDLVWQVVAFVAVSGVLLALCRRPIVKLLNKNNSKTNADAIVGREFALLAPITFGTPGSVKVGDVVWSAAARDDVSEIAQGTIVRVVEIRGNKLIVEKIENKNQMLEEKNQ